MYCSDHEPNFQLPPLFQDTPKHGDDDHSSWTESTLSYRSAARHHAACLKLNQTCKPRSDYRWAATISLLEELPPDEVSKRWKKICRFLRANGIVAAWVAEPNIDTNRVHFHLVISHADSDTLSNILQRSRHQHRCRTWYKPLPPKEVNRYLDYICKASDHHRPVMFKPRTLTKVHTIGKFWKKPKHILDKYLAEKYYHRTVQGMKEKGSLELVNLLEIWTDGTISRRTLCQKVGTASTVRWWSEVPRFESFRRWRNQVCDTNYNPWNF